MKKLAVAVAVIITILSINKHITITIPKEAIRFRVIANSNSNKDQQLKQDVAYNLKKDIKELKLTPKDIYSSRETIKNAIPNFRETIEETLKEKKSNQTYTIEYGMNYFPKKEYKGIVYEEGEYESLVIKLGDGSGENFWCILFPPLCLLEAEDVESDEIEYTSLIKEIIDKYF